ncbi:transporter suffix domain-containing protein [Pelotomaculum propionicicum]|uniref:transporter suffix domain-containing protein n=1 Tax=Pelotomaculum propionicicum TaxID=258475 RepID=UPI003B801422
MSERSQEEPTLKKDEATGSPRIKKIGLLLVILSCVLYAGLILVPFTPYTTGTKAAISSALVVSGEASFWLGALILGKEIVTKYRSYLNPVRWFKKRDS